MRSRLLLALVALLGVAALAGAQTQITTGVIQGTVVDATGAVLPGADVEARNLATNASRNQATNADGRFVFLQLQPGTYSVTVRLAGFATLVQENVPLTVGQTVNLNLAMKVSTVEETVTVTGTALVDTSRTAVANTLNETTIATTPILGRKFEDLLTLTPGVSIVQGPDGDEINFIGQRGIFNNISLDGGDYNNGFFGEQVGGQRAAIDITLDAVQEFQVIATGANAEFGRTAGGVVNVVTKSGSNDTHGSLFYFQRLEALTSELSDGSTLEGFHREQFGGTIGGPLQKDKVFFFIAAEGIKGDFERPNLSAPLGSCPVAAPTIRNDEALINANPECQRLALLDFLESSVGIDDGRPVAHPIETAAILAKIDWNLTPNHRLSASYNFNHSRKENETFDVATYGNSANGIEGDPARINVFNANLFSTLSATTMNEFHFSYSRENRPRTAVQSGLAADTGMGFVPTFRFGDPFFLQPNIDELFWRAQIKDNFSIVTGNHTIKVGGDWTHSLNDQVFRGFFTGRYIFDSVTGFLRYASPAAPGGYGSTTARCADGSYITYPQPCPGGGGPVGGPLLLYLQGAGLTGPATDAAGASNITNDEIGLFVQDQWQVNRNLTVNLGLRWDSQYMADTVDPQTTAYAPFLGDPRFPSDGTIPDQTNMWQPRLGFAWDIKGNAKSVLRANAGVYYPRQNMLSQVGSVTTNGLQQQTIYRDSTFVTFADMPVWPGVVTPAPVAPGEFPLFSGVRAFASDYKNPKITSWNVTFEQELAADWSAYVDFTWAKGVYLTRFIDANRADRGSPFSPTLGETMITNSRGKSLYQGGTLGIRKRFSNGYQLEANYVLAKDLDDDSNERDPFTDRSFNPNLPYDQMDTTLDYAYSDRDIRHKFNAFGFFEVGPLNLNVRYQYRSAQPISPTPVTLTPGGEFKTSRNSLRKDNEFSSLDWRLMWPIRFGSKQQYELVPTVEMFNTFNSDNNINPLSTPALFNFDGFLRTGVGDPRQLQLALRFVF